MKALHFGAGNIGRGFIGKLLADAQVELTFTDVNSALIDLINQQQQYTVTIVGDHIRYEKVTGFSGIDTADPRLIEHISDMDMITTAVGAHILPHIAPILAQGLSAKYQRQDNRPLNIIACENKVRATSQLKAAVLSHLPSSMYDWLASHIGFVDSAVDRIVPPTTLTAASPLDVTVETFSEWIVDQTQFIGVVPTIAGMQPTDNLMAYVERKLFTLNTGHAITAYLGKLAGISTIYDAIHIDTIQHSVRHAMQESGAVLIQRYAFVPSEHLAYIEQILQRFANPFLHDAVERVGRQPLRKLSAEDRLVKPLRGALAYQLPYQYLTMGIAAALHYYDPNDPESVTLQQTIAQQGIASAIQNITGIHEPEVLQAILQQYGQLHAFQPA